LISIIDIQQGSRKAFEQVYHKYHERFFLYVLKQTSSQELAREVVQLAFIKLWEKRGQLSSDYPVEVQLARIVRTTLIDQLRKQAVARKAADRLSQRGLTLAAPTEPYLEKELRIRINHIVSQLPPVCRKVYLLSREEELSYKEIAQLLSISPKSVENHIAKALRLMRRFLINGLILFFFLFFLI
jgi:RNA polymerase sigma-70 factor (family 1)